MRGLAAPRLAQPAHHRATIARGRRCIAVPIQPHSRVQRPTIHAAGIQLAVGPQPLRLRNHNFGLAHRIMVKRLATSPHDPLGITDSTCKNQLVVVSVQYGPFKTYIPIRSTTIGKSKVARDPIAMRTSWRSNSDITSLPPVDKLTSSLLIPAFLSNRNADVIVADSRFLPISNADVIVADSKFLFLRLIHLRLRNS
ncbi:hypothetical protein F511_41366 [Dorcoceras hygrometricum]|uniref:Uncharacterized protein n=1 Tax=Dorcoceras hygrometricum TaxID=472368 RepID=A0A2Z7C3T2_9LAMI|nr:hypothetical protein F511_41366 [Dorcoceras hygrometricum]